MTAAPALPHPRRASWARALVAGWLALAAGVAGLAAFLHAERDRAARFLAAPPPDRRPVAGVPFADLINDAARRHGLDPSLVAAVVLAESGFNPAAVSPRGARGLMQVMPATFREAVPASRCPARPDDPCLHDPALNLRAGASHLRALLARFDGDATLALAAYNAGGRRVEEHRGLPPFPETRRFVERVGMAWAHLHARGGAAWPLLRLVIGYDGWERLSAAALVVMAVAALAAVARRR